MHECPDCNMVCDCDGEDLWQEQFVRCRCGCAESQGLDYEDDPGLGDCCDTCGYPTDDCRCDVLPAVPSPSDSRTNNNG